MKLPAYPRYKPSGVEWLGDVPQHWEVKRLKWVGESIIGLTYSPTDLVSEGEGTLVLRSSNLQGGRIVLDDNVFVSAEIPRKLRTRANDIVICTRNGSRALVGKTAKISEREAGLTFGAFTAVFRSPSNAYMFYVFNSGLFTFQAGLYQTSTIFQLTNGTINAFQIPVPPCDEQQAIVAFLDRETARVDRLVSKKRELIERLKEKRTALISRTVTRGLPPAAARAAGLPANPPLKPSGIDWLGEIPKHWDVRKFSREVAIAEGQVDPEKEPYASMLLIGPEHVESGTGRLLQRATAADQAAESGKFLSRKGDVVYSKIRPALRKLVIAPEDCLCSADMYPLRARKRLDNRFIAWFFLSEEFSGWSVLESDRVAMPKINRDTLNELRMPVPPLPEQVAIAAYLDLETAKLDALAGKVEAALERLQEYRTALITAAVTGKIDVRGGVDVLPGKKVTSASR